MLSLRGLPFGEGKSWKREGDLKQSPGVSSSQRCSLKGMSRVGSLELREKGRRQPGPSGAALSTAAGLKVFGLSQQGQRHRTNQAGPSTDSGTGGAPGEHFSEEKATPATDLVTLLSWEPQPRGERSCLSPTASPSLWQLMKYPPTFHPVKFPPQHC